MFSMVETPRLPGCSRLATQRWMVVGHRLTAGCNRPLATLVAAEPALRYADEVNECMRSGRD